MNKVILIGFVSNEPEVNKNGDKINTKFIMSTNTYRMKRKSTDYHFIQSFGFVAEYVDKYLEKGDYILLEGSLVNGKYKNKSGIEIKNYTVHTSSLEILRKRKFSIKTSKKKVEDIDVKKNKISGNIVKPYYDNEILSDEIDTIDDDFLNS